MKTIAIIGSNGVLGAGIVHALQKTNTIISINRENYSQMQGVSCDVLINANGNSKRFWANEHIIEDFEASTQSVYESIFNFNFKQYIYISSSDVYEDHANIKVTREDQSVNPQNLSSYGFHKYLSEIIVKKYAENYYILRSSLILGKNLKKGPIYDLLLEKPLYITKDSRLQMITAEAIASIIDYLLKKKFPSATFNMGGQGVVDFSKIEKYFRKKISVSASAEKQIYEMDISNLKKIYPLKTSEEYLQEYINQMNLEI